MDQCHHAPGFRRPDVVTEPLYVVTTVFNSPRYRSRWKLYGDFAKRVVEAGAKLVIAEVAFGERAFALTEPNRIDHVQLRTSHEIWHKERALNLAVQRLPQDWKYVAWIDADVQFLRDDWADECVHALQHYPVIQMWRTATDLDPDYEPIATMESFAWCHERGLPTKVHPGGYYDAAGGGRIKYPHPGYAWAMRRDAWDTLGGLIDWAILGAGDANMAHALLGQVDWTLQLDYHPGFVKQFHIWQERAESIKQNLGCMRGGILHHWHGPKTLRRYQTRPEILVRHQFDPAVHIKPDWQGLHQLSGPPGLRDDIRRYFHERNEDAI